MKAFYFATEERKLRYGDERKIEVGLTHKVEGSPILCGNGLHASTRIIDALNYAPGPILYLVELGGKIDKGSDKICALERTYIAEYDATDLLRQFSRDQAMINIEKIKPYASNEEFKLIIKWLTTGDESLRSAARSAAESAARSAARSAAWSAANETLLKMVKKETGWDI